MKYVKKPVVVEAFQFGVDEMPDWFGYMHKALNYDLNLEGSQELVAVCFTSPFQQTMTANKGDYIIKESNGEIYPCKADIFEATYEKVEE